MSESKHKPNPLSDSERASMYRVMEHDDMFGALGILNQLANAWAINAARADPKTDYPEIKGKDEFDAAFDHFHGMFLGLKYLIHKDQVLGPASTWFYKADFATVTTGLGGSNASKFTIDAKIPDNVITNPSIVYQIAFNLVKNAQYKADKITITGESDVSLEDIVFNPVPDMSAKWWRLKVHDTGNGFPSDPKEFLEDGISSQSGSGFGLHFIKLAATYLNAPLGIHSEPGNTWVGLYQPMTE